MIACEREREGGRVREIEAERERERETGRDRGLVSHAGGRDKRRSIDWNTWETWPLSCGL